LGSRVENFPNSKYCKEAEEKIAAAYQELARDLKASAEKLETNIAAATTKHVDWPWGDENYPKIALSFHSRFIPRFKIFNT
jgi:hypothetical protein